MQERARPLDKAAAALTVVDTGSPKRTAAYCNEAAPAERRQLTIASCELLLELAATTMDPEDLSETTEDYHRCVVETVGRHNGLVAHTYGNTAVVYFGYPQAHEDDPERAVRAALELISTVAARTVSYTHLGFAVFLDPPKASAGRPLPNSLRPACW